MSGDGTTEYPDDFVAGLEHMWGEGFLSPGGPAEVAAILEGIDLSGLRVLDIGCGIGGVDVELVLTHGAGAVVGVDVEPQLVERARALVAKRGIADRVSCEVVEPGPFAQPDASFDVVFSKDSMIHIPDKPALFAEVLRVLKPGGLFVASDWLRGEGADESEIFRHWRELVGLTFRMATPAETQAAMEAAGFAGAEVRDRNAWYREEVRREVEAVQGEGFERLAARVGREYAERRQRSNAARLAVVEAGFLRPCHLRGRRAE